MSQLKAIEAESVDLFKDDVNNFLALPANKIDAIISFSRNGVDIAKAYEEKTEDELVERVAKACEMDNEKVMMVLRFFKNIVSDLLEEDYLTRIANDLKVLGYTPKQIQKITAVITRLEKGDAPKRMKRAKDRVMLSEVVLPYLTAIECVHDYRYLINEGTIQEKIPLLILRLHLSSNIDEKHDDFINFQMDVSTTKRVIEILNEKLNEFNYLEYDKTKTGK